MIELINIEINPLDLIGKKYKVYDNSYNFNTITRQWENLCDIKKNGIKKEFTIISIPFKAMTETSIGTTDIHTFILVKDDDSDAVYQVLFMDRGLVL